MSLKLFNTHRDSGDSDENLKLESSDSLAHALKKSLAMTDTVCVGPAA